VDERSEFWRELGAQHQDDLDRYGFEEVKRHQALTYFTWRWNWTAAVRSSQLRFLLTHVSPRDWVRAWQKPERSDAAWTGVDWSGFERRLFTFAVRLLWIYAERHGSPAVLALPEPELGAPLPVRWRGRLISQDLANSALEVAGMEPALEDPRSFLEIGAGYGRTAYALLRLFPKAKYTIVDIPPAIEISRWYLGRLFERERLRFLMPDDVEEIAPASVDLALSISSLQEMTGATVAAYLDLFDRVAAGGHVYLKQWTKWRNEADGITMAFADYPFPHRWAIRRMASPPVQTEFTEALWAVPS